jgi:hypothetical protein
LPAPNLPNLENAMLKRAALHLVALSSILFCIDTAFGQGAFDPQWRSVRPNVLETTFTADGEQWFITSESGGNGMRIGYIKDKIFHYVGGEALKITAVGGRDIWVAAQDYSVWRFNRGTQYWDRMPGVLSDVESSVSGDLYGLGRAWNDDGYDIWRWTGEDWERFDGNALKIAVDRDGSLWRVRPDFTIQKYDGHRWLDVPGRARDIAIGGDGSVWAIGLTPTYGGFVILHYDQGAWQQATGAGERVFVNSNGAPSVVNASLNAWTGLPYRLR